MATATLSSKGQLVIPKSVREYMHLQAGDRVDFIVQDDGESWSGRPQPTSTISRAFLEKPGRA